jgi:hypothetical protein
VPARCRSRRGAASSPSRRPGSAAAGGRDRRPRARPAGRALRAAADALVLTEPVLAGHS